MKRVASAAERDIVVVGGLGMVMVMGWWWVVGAGRWCRRGIGNDEVEIFGAVLACAERYSIEFLALHLSRPPPNLLSNQDILDTSKPSRSVFMFKTFSK